jgi:hypothetical protein
LTGFLVLYLSKLILLMAQGILRLFQKRAHFSAAEMPSNFLPTEIPLEYEKQKVWLTPPKLGKSSTHIFAGAHALLLYDKKHPLIPTRYSALYLPYKKTTIILRTTWLQKV